MQSIPDSYEASRERFRGYLELIQKAWPAAQLTSHALPHEDDLTVDVISAEAAVLKQRLLVLSTGLHGMEGYVGSGILEMFIREYLSRLDPETTGLLLVHAINPWGMKHWRRGNPNNVDLNRNFIEGDFSALIASNEDYPLLSFLLNPQKPLGGIRWENLRFNLLIPINILRFGVQRIREAALKGQYSMPEGIYFGGLDLQPETQLMMGVYRSTFPGYAQIVHLDLHTGYGARNQMSLVLSPRIRLSSDEVASRYHLPRVVAATPGDFYSMQGDMADWEYDLVANEFPTAAIFSATCEFGTYGESLVAGIRSLRITIFKNQVNVFGASPSTRKWVDEEYRELYLPSEPGWLTKVLADSRMTFEGVLGLEGYLK